MISSTQAGEPIMKERTREELEAIIQDFTIQLCVARAEGWNQSKPEHFRAIVAALKVALEERRRSRGRRMPRAELPTEAARAIGGDRCGLLPAKALWRTLAQRALGFARSWRAIDAATG
jgi:hypothetical protein